MEKKWLSVAQGLYSIGSATLMVRECFFLLRSPDSMFLQQVGKKIAAGKAGEASALWLPPHWSN